MRNIKRFFNYIFENYNENKYYIFQNQLVYVNSISEWGDEIKVEYTKQDGSKDSYISDYKEFEIDFEETNDVFVEPKEDKKEDKTVYKCNLVYYIGKRKVETIKSNIDSKLAYSLKHIYSKNPKYKLGTVKVEKVVKSVKESFEVDYKGEHEAPTIESGAPMYNLKGIYDDDIYTNGLKMYGDETNDADKESLNIIKSAKGKPYMKVKIYRAIPDYNKEVNKKISVLVDILNYKDRFNFFPPKTKLIYDLQDKYPIIDNVRSYEEQQELIYKDIESQIKELVKEKKTPIKINNGDWVTISKSYAMQHGKENLQGKYKLITKTVPAKHLFTDGNDLKEWGYDSTKKGA